MTRDQLIHWQKRRKLGRLRYTTMMGALGFAPVAFIICQAFNIGETMGGVMGLTSLATVVGIALASSLFSFNERVFLEEISRRGLGAESDLTQLPPDSPKELINWLSADKIKKIIPERHLKVLNVKITKASKRLTDHF